MISTHLETADNWLRGSFRYQEIVGEGRKYFQIGKRVVWANRVRGGTLLGQFGTRRRAYLILVQVFFTTIAYARERLDQHLANKLRFLTFLCGSMHNRATVFNNDFPS